MNFANRSWVPEFPQEAEHVSHFPHSDQVGHLWVLQFSDSTGVLPHAYAAGPTNFTKDETQSLSRMIFPLPQEASHGAHSVHAAHLPGG